MIFFQSVFSDTNFAQFNHKNDEVQMGFYRLMQGDPTIWPGQLRENLNAIRANNFSSAVSVGTDHCMLNSDEFYNGNTTAGKPIYQWFRDIN